jgi:hypothetical protein
LADALPSFPATNYKPNQKSHKLRAQRLTDSSRDTALDGAESKSLSRA